MARQPVSKDVHYLVEAAESEMTVEAFYSKYGYLLAFYGALNVGLTTVYLSILWSSQRRSDY